MQEPGAELSNTSPIVGAVSPGPRGPMGTAPSPAQLPRPAAPPKKAEWSCTKTFACLQGTTLLSLPTLQDFSVPE